MGLRSQASLLPQLAAMQIHLPPVSLSSMSLQVQLCLSPSRKRILKSLHRRNYRSFSTSVGTSDTRKRRGSTGDATIPRRDDPCAHRAEPLPRGQAPELTVKY